MKEETIYVRLRDTTGSYVLPETNFAITNRNVYEVPKTSQVMRAIKDKALEEVKESDFTANNKQRKASGETPIPAWEDYGKLPNVAPSPSSLRVESELDPETEALRVKAMEKADKEAEAEIAAQRAAEAGTSKTSAKDSKEAGTSKTSAKDSKADKGKSF